MYVNKHIKKKKKKFIISTTVSNLPNADYIQGWVKINENVF